MFTCTVYRFYGFTLMLMQIHNKVQFQSHGTGVARVPGWVGRSQGVLESISWMGYGQIDLGFMKNISENVSHNRPEVVPLVFNTELLKSSKF